MTFSHNSRPHLVVFHPGSKTKSIIQNDFWLRPVAIHFLWRAPGEREGRWRAPVASATAGEGRRGERDGDMPDIS
jgi:hypothetical protein